MTFDHGRKHSAFVAWRTQLLELINQEINRLKQSYADEAKQSIRALLEMLLKQLKSIDSRRFHAQVRPRESTNQRDPESVTGVLRPFKGTGKVIQSGDRRVHAEADHAPELLAQVESIMGIQNERRRASATPAQMLQDMSMTHRRQSYPLQVVSPQIALCFTEQNQSSPMLQQRLQQTSFNTRVMPKKSRFLVRRYSTSLDPRKEFKNI